MSAQGSGYDLSCNIYSTDGRVFQVEYAEKAVESGGALIGLQCKNGVVIGAEKLIAHKLLLPTSGRMVHRVGESAGLAYTGYVPDGRALVPAAESECNNYKDYYGENMPPGVLASRLGEFMHAHTCYGGYRPFGLGVLVAGFDEFENKAFLHMLNPAGVNYRFYGAAIGKGRQAAKTEIEKLDLQNLTVEEGLKHIAYIIKLIREEPKDKDYVLEAGWVRNDTKEFTLVPEALIIDANKYAVQKIREEDQAD